MDRREFLAMASVFGASTAMAYGNARPLADPAAGRGAKGKKGGTLKVAHDHQGHEGPAQVRLVGNGQCRAPGATTTGQLHHRIHVPAPSAGKLGRQRRRHRIHAACAQGREVVERRRFQRRRRRLQPDALVRQVGRGQFDGRPYGHADRCRRQARRRRRNHQGRRPHGHAEDFSQSDITHHSRLARLSGPHRPPDFDEEGWRHDQDADRHRTIRAGFLRCRRRSAVYKRRADVKWWGGEALSRRHRVHRLRHRCRAAIVSAFEAGEIDTQLSRPRPTMCRSSTAWAW